MPEARIVDPALRAEVRDFIGQEASHRFVHQQYNAELAAQGLVFVREAKPERRIRLLARLDPLDGSAVTCAVEHFTAMLADGVLALPGWLDGAEPDMHTLWSWHAVEESEHKGVAMDVYRAAGGGYWRRVLVVSGGEFHADARSALQTADSLRRDGELWKARTWLSAARTWLGRDGILWHLARPGLRYSRAVVPSVGARQPRARHALARRRTATPSTVRGQRSATELSESICCECHNAAGPRGRDRPLRKHIRTRRLQCPKHKTARKKARKSRPRP